MCYDEIGICAQNMDTILGSLVWLNCLHHKVPMCLSKETESSFYFDLLQLLMEVVKVQ